MVKRVSKGNKDGGQFAPDTRGKNPPTPGVVNMSVQNAAGDDGQTPVGRAFSTVQEKIEKPQASAVVGLPVILTLKKDGAVIVDVDMSEAAEGVDENMYDDDDAVAGDGEMLIRRLEQCDIVHPEYGENDENVGSAVVGLPVMIDMYSQEKIKVSVDMAEAAEAVQDAIYDDYGVDGDGDALVRALAAREGAPVDFNTVEL